VSTVRENRYFRQEFVLATCNQISSLFAPIRKQEPSQQERREDARYGSDQTHGSDLEYRKRLKPLVPGNAINQQVGRCPNQCQRAAEDGSIGERDQQPGGRNVQG